MDDKDYIIGVDLANGEDYSVVRPVNSVEEQEPTFVLMFSGGLDSYLALLTLLDGGIKPKLVYAQHGSKNNDEQIYQAKKLARKHNLELIVDRTLNLGAWETETAYIPNRNGMLASVGAMYGDYIYFAIMDGEQTYSDCREDTFMALSVALTKLYGAPKVVNSPFWELTKGEVIERLNPVHYPELLRTYSCHNGGDIHCGYCSACFRRWVAFEINGIKDDFLKSPYGTGLAEDYWHRVIEDGLGSGYGDKRDNEIIKAFESVGANFSE